MKQFWATFLKDLLILWRDRAGMLVLFVMPMALVLVVSLVQNNVMEATGQSALKVLLVDADQGFIGAQIRQRLADTSGLRLLDRVGSQVLDEESARQLVASGDYQFGVLIPAGMSERLRAAVIQQSEQTLSPAGQQTEQPLLEIELFFDPTVQGVFRTAVRASLQHALLGLEVAEKERELAQQLVIAFGLESPKDDAPPKQQTTMLALAESQAELKNDLRPNAVQQNVPAWSLFGMFFIVVPLSGALLRERQQGTLRRLLTLPVPYGVLLSGKTLAYVTVCMVQFCLMLLAGKYLLPLFGTPVLELGATPHLVFLLAFCAALAATGYGLLIGTLARSYEQASMFGAVSVVIAAALGGVMVPAYVMPKGMQLISNFSPLSWGLNGFLELFVRSGDVQGITRNLFALLGFFLVTTAFSMLAFRRCERSG